MWTCHCKSPNHHFLHLQPTDYIKHTRTTLSKQAITVLMIYWFVWQTEQDFLLYSDQMIVKEMLSRTCSPRWADCGQWHHGTEALPHSKWLTDVWATHHFKHSVQASYDLQQLYLNCWWEIKRGSHWEKQLCSVQGTLGMAPLMFKDAFWVSLFLWFHALWSCVKTERSWLSLWPSNNLS